MKQISDKMNDLADDDGGNHNNEKKLKIPTSGRGAKSNKCKSWIRSSSLFMFPEDCFLRRACIKMVIPIEVK